MANIRKNWLKIWENREILGVVLGASVIRGNLPTILVRGQ
jgi:hypothetical protein